MAHSPSLPSELDDAIAVMRQTNALMGRLLNGRRADDAGDWAAAAALMPAYVAARALFHADRDASQAGTRT